MKFPKSVHADGWADHIDTTAPEHLPDALKPGKNRFIKPADALAKPMSAEAEGMQRPRVYMNTPSEAPRPTISAPTAPVIVARKSPNATPWVVGGGLAVVAIAVAMTMSHNMPSKSSAPPPTVMGEAKPSPEDAQIAAAPTAAGPVTPEAAQPEAAPPVTAQAPVVEPKSTVVAAAPTAPAPKAQAPQPAPVAKTLTPRPEVLAQASPPPVTLRDPVVPVAPTVMPSTPQPQPTTPPPEQATPTLPPMAQAQPAPDLAVVEDAGITGKVKTALATDAMLSAAPIAVTTDHGVVKLEGQVPDTQARERATVVAAATQGVKAVDNRLTLPPVALLQQQLEPQQVARAPSSN